MARSYEYVTHATEETTTSTTLTDANASGHLTASFASGTWYAIFSFDVGAQDNAAVSEVQCVIDGVSTGEVVGWSPTQDDTTNRRFRSFFRVFEFTGDGTSQTLKLQFRTTNSLDAARLRNVSIVALSAEAGDVFHSNTTSDTTTSSAYGEFDSFTPASGTYFVVSSAMISNSNASGRHGSRIQFDGSSLNFNDEDINRVNNPISLNATGRIVATGTETVDLDFNRQSAGTTTLHEWHCLLLDASTFDDSDYVNETASSTTTTSTSYVEHDTLAVNGDGNTNNWLILASYQTEFNGTGSGGGTYGQVTWDGTVIQATDNLVHGVSNTPLASGMVSVVTGDGASAAMDMDVKSENGGSARIVHTDGGSWMVALDLDGGGSAAAGAQYYRTMALRSY